MKWGPQRQHHKSIILILCATQQFEITTFDVLTTTGTSDIEEFIAKNVSADIAEYL